MSAKAGLVVPALRASMGDWIYYIGFMKFTDIDKHIHIAEDLHSAESLKELLQRALSTRGKEIANYLVSTDQRLFNSIVVGSYGGSTNFLELAVNSSEFPEDLEGALGVLKFDGTEKLFAIDGQHRVSGIKLAIKQDPTLGKDEVAVVFVKGVSSPSRQTDPQGFERTRRLFTNLNQHAKAVKKTDIIALDEDDAAAILARDLVDDHPLFKNRISAARSQNLNALDSKSLTHITVLYDTVHYILGTKKSKLSRRPSSFELARLRERVFDFWTIFQMNVAAFGCFRESEAPPVSNYRHRGGGDLIFRPIGLSMFVEVITLLRAKQTDGNLVEAIRLASKLPRELSQTPWAGLLWDTINNRMLADALNKKVARRLMIYSLGLDLGIAKTTPEKLIDELASIVGTRPELIDLPKYGPSL